MAAQEDQALLLLIFQHLKGNGFAKAARVLEKHVPQLKVEEPPAESLHEIYTGWMKLCSLAQHDKQETDDGVNKKSVRVEFTTSEEDAAVPKRCDFSGEDEVKAKLQFECESDIVESSHPEKIPEGQSELQRDAINSVQLEQLDSEGSDSSDTQVEEEKMKEELTKIKLEASAEVSNEEKVSPDIQEPVPSSQPELNQALDADPTEGPQEDADASKELITHSSTSEVPDEAPAAEKVDSDLTKAPDVLDAEKDEEKPALEPTQPIIVDLTEEETNDHLAESQVPPPADCATEEPKDEEEEQEQPEQEEENDEKSESVGGAVFPSELNPDAAAEKSTKSQKPAEAADPPTSQSDVPEEPEVSIILNIQIDCEAVQQGSSQSVPEESSESCADSKTPKKKKKRMKRDMEMPETDTQATDAPSTSASDPSETPLTSKSSKKKKRHQKRNEDDQKKEEDPAEEEEFIPLAASEKKKAKKRKRDKEAVDTTFETKTTKTQLKDLEEEENTPAEMTEKPKKKKRKKEKEAPSEEAPAEGDEETKMESIDDGSTALLFSGKKQRLCRKLSLRTRQRFHGKKEKMRKMMNSIHSRQKLMGKKKQNKETLDEKTQMNPVKGAQADHETEIKPPKRRRRRRKKMKITTEQEESSLKENEPPGKEKKSMKTRAKNRAEEEFPEEDLSLLSNGEKKKKKKKKKKSVEMSQPPPSKKKKKSSLKAGMEDASLDADSLTPTVSAKKKKSSS